MVEYPGEGYRQSHWGLLRHHCHYTVASADSKFDDLSDTGIDSIIDFTIPKNTKKATTGEYLFCCLRYDICKRLDIPVFSDEDEKP